MIRVPRRPVGRHTDTAGPTGTAATAEEPTMRTSTRRAAQLAVTVLAGAGALAATSAPASALPTTTRASSTIGGSTIDVGSLVLRDATIHLPPVICCGNLGPVASDLEQAFTTGAR
jgi:hypothetical protein